MADCTNFDLLLVDWLYDELEPAEAARFMRHIDGCEVCWHTAESMRYIRALMRELPEEPPPEAALAPLLHQAAAQVAGAPRRGLLAWLAGSFELVWAHPAAAALATMVLVAGVAGALFTRGPLKLANMAAPEASRSSESAHLRAGDAPMAGAQPVAKGEAPAPAVVPPSDKSAEESDQLDQDRAPRRRAARTRGDVRRDGAAAELEARERGEAKLHRLSPARQRASAGASGAASAGGSRREPAGAFAVTPADGLTGVPGRVADDAAEAAPEPDSASTARPESNDARAQPRQQARKRGEPTWAETMHDALRTALRQEQCARAVRIADDIRARDPGYYRARIADGEELAGCRQPAGSQADRKRARDAD